MFYNYFNFTQNLHPILTFLGVELPKSLLSTHLPVVKNPCIKVYTSARFTVSAVMRTGCNICIKIKIFMARIT